MEEWGEVLHLLLLLLSEEMLEDPSVDRLEVV